MAGGNMRIWHYVHWHQWPNSGPYVPAHLEGKPLSTLMLCGRSIRNLDIASNAKARGCTNCKRERRRRRWPQWLTKAWRAQK
jgi:hypothetical protein